MCKLLVLVEWSAGASLGASLLLWNLTSWSDVIQKWVMYVCQSVSNDCSELVCEGCDYCTTATKVCFWLYSDVMRCGVLL
jgi:hypothetical protein